MWGASIHPLEWLPKKEGKKTADDSKCWPRYRATVTHAWLTGINLYIYGKQFTKLFYINSLLHVPVILLLIYTQEKLKHMFTQNLYVNVIIALFDNCQKLETTNMSFICNWLNKEWYIHTVDYYSAIKRINYWFMHQHKYILDVFF